MSEPGDEQQTDPTAELEELMESNPVMRWIGPISAVVVGYFIFFFMIFGSILPHWLWPAGVFTLPLLPVFYWFWLAWKKGKVTFPDGTRLRGKQARQMIFIVVIMIGAIIALRVLSAVYGRAGW